MGDQAPLVTVIQIPVEPVGTAGNDLSTAIKVPVAGDITSVSYVPVAARAGADTNSRTLNLINKKQDGTGTTSVASLALVSGVNLAAFDEKAITLTSTAADRAVAIGDVLQWQSLHILTGIVDPGGTVVVEITRSA